MLHGADHDGVSAGPSWATGFTSFDVGPPITPELQAFLDAGEPPVFFTLGDSASVCPGNFSSKVRWRCSVASAVVHPGGIGIRSYVGRFQYWQGALFRNSTAPVVSMCNEHFSASVFSRAAYTGCWTACPEA
jgi:hypothetical protein